MKKIHLLFTGTALLIVAFQMTGCRKFLDKYFPGHGNNKEECEITKIVIDDAALSAKSTGLFYYNQKGNADSVIFDEGFGGPRTHYFKYDNQHRLIEYNSYYDDQSSPENYYTLHKYEYSGGRIVTDSAFWRVAGVYVQVSNFEYDWQGRVVKEFREVVMSDGEPTSHKDTLMYDYDESNNLVRSSGEYDDKKNYLRTNKVWQFIERDYSVNNYAGATGYNNEDLPLGFNTSPGTVRFLFHGEMSEIEYDCE